MPYSAEISRTNPTCLLFLIDHSNSMAGSFAGQPGKKKDDGVADAINRLLQNLVLKCAKSTGVRDYFHIGVIGYGAEVKPVSMPASQYASSASWTIAYSESFVYHHEWFKTRAHDYTPAFYNKIAAAGMTSSVDRIVSQRIRQVVTREFADVMKEVDVIVTPTSRTLASESMRISPLAKRTLPWTADMSSVTRPVSLAGYPGMSIPGQNCLGFNQFNGGLGAMGSTMDQGLILLIQQVVAPGE